MGLRKCFSKKIRRNLSHRLIVEPAREGQRCATAVQHGDDDPLLASGSSRGVLLLKDLERAQQVVGLEDFEGGHALVDDGQRRHACGAASPTAQLARGVRELEIKCGTRGYILSELRDGHRHGEL